MNRFKKFFSRQKAQFEDRNKLKIYCQDDQNSVYTLNSGENSTVESFMSSRGLKKQWLSLQILCKLTSEGRQVGGGRASTLPLREPRGHQPGHEGLPPRQVEAAPDARLREVFLPPAELVGAGVPGGQPVLRPGPAQRQPGRAESARDGQPVGHGQGGQSQA